MIERGGGVGRGDVVLHELLDYLPPLVSSLSMGCLSAVMSRNVNRNNTTRSLSLRMGAT